VGQSLPIGPRRGTSGIVAPPCQSGPLSQDVYSRRPAPLERRVVLWRTLDPNQSLLLLVARLFSRGACTYRRDQHLNSGVRFAKCRWTCGVPSPCRPTRPRLSPVTACSRFLSDASEAHRSYATQRREKRWESEAHFDRGEPHTRLCRAGGRLVTTGPPSASRQGEHDTFRG